MTGHELSGRLRNGSLELASSLLVIVRDLASVLRGEYQGFGVAGNRVSVLAILGLVAVERGKQNVRGGGIGSTETRSAKLDQDWRGEVSEKALTCCTSTCGRCGSWRRQRSL